ncbi:MAG: hypothetical protein HFG60_06445 [Lachnospiraceae bacterium]|nr:hypothetical protein [Lachnospiraceae bacterium]MCI9184625.1 hypothetical protein [Lachnospiraceae bacterium]
MINQEKKWIPRNEALLLDLLHIVIGVLVVICAVLAFLDPEDNQILFPVIFWLAGLLNGVSGWYKLKNSGRSKKKKAGGIALLMMGAALAALGVISIISIGRLP